LTQRSQRPCIYCSKRAPTSQEHWFPRWLGDFDACEPLLGRLCGPCNRHLGKIVDQDMSRLGPEALSRYRLKIAGRDTDWMKANPFTYRSQPAEAATTARTMFPDLDFETLVEDIPGSDPPERRPLRQLILTDASGARTALRVPDGVNADWLRQAVEGRGLGQAKLTHVVCEAVGPDDEPLGGTLPDWFRAAVGAVFPDAANIAWYLREGGPKMTLPSPTTLNLSLAYTRGLAKIAFHYFLKYDPHVTGAEENFTPIKRFIYDGTGGWQDFVTLGARPFLIARSAPRYCAHFLMAESDSVDVLRVRMQFFVNGPYPAAPVAVTLGPDRYTRHLDVAHVLRLYDPPSGAKAGVLAPIKVVRLGGHWGAVIP